MLVLFFCIFYFITFNANGATWNYNSSSLYGPANWGNKYPFCADEEQSPIDISFPPINEYPVESNLIFDLPPFPAGHLKLENNGHTLTIKPLIEEDKNWEKLDGMQGGPLGYEKYDLHSIHFHWGSEHHYDGEKFPLEGHFVHYNDKYNNFETALTHEDGLSVLGVHFQIGPEDNPAFEVFTKLFDDITQPNTSIIIEEELDLHGMIPVNAAEDWMMYLGSLTTPPCYESVTWLLLHDAMNISESQMRAFTKLLDEDYAPILDNHRPVQPMNGRKVFSPASVFLVDLLIDITSITLTEMKAQLPTLKKVLLQEAKKEGVDLFPKQVVPSVFQSDTSVWFYAHIRINKLRFDEQKTIILTLNSLLKNNTLGKRLYAEPDFNSASMPVFRANPLKTPDEVLTANEARLVELKKLFAQHDQDANSFWILICGTLVFFMQAGFSMLEAGSVREKNVNNILYKNLMDAAFGALGFYLYGYGIAFGGDNDNGFMGSTNWALSHDSNDSHTYDFFFFQWAFAATAATIVSGAVAERTRLSAYFLISFVLTTFTYPIVVHWIWDSEGWLSVGNPEPFPSGCSAGKGCSNGMIDFAGSGVVHMVGGYTALLGACWVGPRHNRFAATGGDEFAGHSNLLATLGVAILWVGWYGFNCGSTLAVIGQSILIHKVAINTTLSAGSSAVTTAFWQRFVTPYLKNRSSNVKKSGHWSLVQTLNGILAGLVGITAGCSVVDPWGALLIGILSGLVYMTASEGLKRAKVDDPLDAFPVHGACGTLGVIAVGIFGSDENVKLSVGNDNDAMLRGEQLGVQILGAVAIIAWTLSVMSITMKVLSLALGGMRMSQEAEVHGLDKAEHGGAAYRRSLMT